MKCKFCGAEIDDELNVCPECGKDLGEDAENEEYTETPAADETDALTEENAGTGETDGGEEAYFDADTEDTEYFENSEEAAAAEDGENGEDGEDGYTDAEPEIAQPKSKLPKIIAAVLIAVIVIGAAAFAGLKFFAPSALTGILSAMGIDTADRQPLVYTTQEDGTYKSYIAYSGKAPVLLASSTKSSFVENSDFVMGKKDVYYLNDGSLYTFAAGTKTAAKIKDGAQNKSMVVSADGKKLLFTTASEESGKSDLWLYNKGKTDKIATIGAASASSYSVNYGFSRGVDDGVWYIDANAPAQADGENAAPTAANGSLYVKKASGDAAVYQENVSDIKYFDIKSNLLVYTSTKPADENSGETAAAASESMYLKEASGDPQVLVNDYYMQPIIVVNKPQRGVVYLSDAQKAEGEDGGMQSFQSTYNLMFKPVGGGEATTIDTGVAYVYNAECLTSTLYDSNNYANDKAKGDFLLYIKGQNLFITGNLKAPSEDAAMDFAQSAPPTFSKNMDIIAYMSADGKLSYRKITNGNLGETVTVAEKVAQFKMSSDGKKIAYVTLTDEKNPSSGTATLYTVADGKTAEISQNVYPLVYFAANGSDVYYIDSFDQEKQSAALKAYLNGSTVSVQEDISNFVMSESGVPYILKMQEGETTMVTISTFDKPSNVQVIDDGIVGISAY